MEKINNNWDFLKAPRFWVMVIGAVSLCLYQKGLIDGAIMTMIGTIAGGFIGVRTIDRAAERIGGQVEEVKIRV